MTINDILIQALAPLGCPVVPDVYEGPEKTYVTFNYTEVPELPGDNFPAALRYLVQVHLFLPAGANPFDEKRTIKRRLVAADLTYPTVENASDLEGQHYVFECQWLGGAD